MSKQNIVKGINEATQFLGKTWPLYSFVTSNPLAGYEKLPFVEAIKKAEKLFGSKGLPEAKVFKTALENGEIDRELLSVLLKEYQITESIEETLLQMEKVRLKTVSNNNHDVDRITTKWLSVFMDEGISEWQMPYRNKGFYKAWKQLAIHDIELKGANRTKIPETSIEVLNEILSDFNQEDYVKIFTHHLTALPGWTGYIKYRTEENSEWHKKYPVTLEDYLAVRLWIAKALNGEILPKEDKIEDNTLVFTLQYVWLKAWEQSWQHKFIENFSKTSTEKEEAALEAQMVFCIDTRSEVIRRHVEACGNYETFGYAGFFGIAMDYKDMNDGITKKSCPPIVPSAYKVSEISQEGKTDEILAYKKRTENIKFGNYFFKRMKNMLPSSFGYVEGSGPFYGFSLVARTLFPSYYHDIKKSQSKEHESICQPDLKGVNNTISLDEKVAIVKSAFDLMGWENFAPLVLFVGHGSHTTNNPFGSSLDCGACAASPGRHNARMLAKLANMKDVREVLVNDYEIKIPENTVFIGAEHNTTTDEIVIFDAEVSDKEKHLLKTLKSNLLKAQQTATQERLGTVKNSISTANKKATNWSETRPEWGLANNAGFVIGQRELTKKSNLNGRCFLHSYNWKLDKEGKALQGIMQGAMVVTQWINNHYYFSAVDSQVFGGGTKITHNVTGNYGVVQGNGGDLKRGLPLQSLFKSDDEIYHQPIRLSVFIEAPLERVSEIIEKNESIKQLLDNEWIYLMVIDVLDKNKIKSYQKHLEWKLIENKKDILLDLEKVPLQEEMAERLYNRDEKLS